ncbi:MAG: SH3 domain-containing protein [Bdellovibrio sp.]|nr:SH3 domain-containing protein [Methylotenera sp.]
MKNYLKKYLLISLAAPILALAGEAGTALKADVLRAEPFADAKTAGSLNKNDTLDILAKKGAWLQVKSKSASGWVRILSVKRGGASVSGSSIADIASGRAGTGKVVSTTGIRGLSAEELKAAKFNEDEMKKMESHAVSATDAQSFASAGGLTSAQMAYFKGAK